MGRRYEQTLNQQIHQRLNGMYAKGDGVGRDGASPEEIKDKVYTTQTMKTYYTQGKNFTKYVRETDPSCTSLKHAKEYVRPYLEHEISAGKSAWTVATERASLNKIFQISPGDKDFVSLPKRTLGSETNNRYDTKYMKHFSEANNQDLVAFCKGTGARRDALSKLTGDKLYSREDVRAEIARLAGKADRTEGDEKRLTAFREAMEYFPDKEHFVLWEGDKHNRTRVAPVADKYEGKVLERFANTKDGERVFKHVSKACPVHRYRADYCREIYNEYARDEDEIEDRQEIYCGRGVHAGFHADRVALTKASKAMGHNRASVTMESYLRGV